MADLIARLPAIRWFVATVASVQASVNEVTINYKGATVPHCAYLASYTAPAPGDTVHVITDQNTGLLVLGKEVLRAATPPPTPPAPTVIAPTGTANWHAELDPPRWVTGEPVKQGDGVTGAWFYDQSALTALAGVTMAKFEIQLNLAIGATTALSFVVHDNTDTTVPLSTASMAYLHTTTPGLLAWVPLPLNWARRLTDPGDPGRGLGLASDIYSAVITSGGTLRFTPL